MSSGPVVVLGASGQVGVFLIPRLLGAGQSVLAVSRSARPPAFPEFSAARWIGESELAREASSSESLVSAGPLALARAALDHLPGIRRVVALSTTSVHVKADSPDRFERRQMAAIVDAERALATACARRSVRLCILRPTLVYGAGLDQNVSLLARWASRFGFVPVAGKATGLRQPVHADDVALAAVEALLAGHDLPLELVLAGGSTLSYRAMALRSARAARPGARVISVPPGLLAAATAVRGLLPGAGRVGAAMVRRQSRDLVFDDELARRLLGHAPRPFRPGPGDLAFPVAERLQALARDVAAAGVGGKDGKMQDYAEGA